MKYRVLFLTFLLVVCFCSCGPQKLTRDLATQLIKESETFQKKQGNIKFHKTGFDKMKKHEMLEMIIVGKGYFKQRELQVKNEYQNIFSLGYIKSYTSHKKYIIMLNNPVPIKLTEVTGITDAATGKGVKEAQFVWEYSELPSLVRRFVIKGGKGTAYMRLYDDGWRTDEINLETTDEPIQLTKEEIEQEKKELKEIADRIAVEKERIAAEKERKRKEAKEYISAGIYEKAIPFLKLEIKENPANAEMHYLLATALLLKGDVRASKNELQRTVKLDASFLNDPSFLFIYKVRTEPNNRKKVANAEKLIERFPKHPEADKLLEVLGNGKFIEGDFNGARTHYKRIVDEFPTSEMASVARKHLELIEHPRVTARVSNADDKAILYVNGREAIKT